MKIFGILGHPLGHSFSRKYFNTKFRKERLDCIYQNFDLEDISKISGVLENENIKGLNVTIPHKSTVLNYCDSLTEEVKEIGAANTLLIEKGRIKAYNSDYLGFIRSLDETPIDKEKKAIVLGSGGSSKAIQYALKKMQIEAIVVSRSPENDQIDYSGLTQEIMAESSLIINF